MADTSPAQTPAADVEDPHEPSTRPTTTTFLNQIDTPLAPGQNAASPSAGAEDEDEEDDDADYETGAGSEAEDVDDLVFEDAKEGNAE